MDKVWRYLFWGVLVLWSRRSTAMMPGGVFTSLKPVRLALTEILHQIAELDLNSNAGVSWWSLRGLTQMAPIQISSYSKIASPSNVKNVCESAFNAGHSAAVFLSSNAHVKYWGFDTLGLPYSKRSLAAVQRMFPGRVEVVEGAPETTLPTFKGRGIICDVFSITGRHDYDAVQADIANARQVAPPGGIIIADDISETCAGCLKAWEEAVSEGVIVNAHCSSPPRMEGQWVKRWCYGFFAPATKESTEDVGQLTSTWKRRYKYGHLTSVHHADVTVSAALSAVLDGLSQVVEANTLDNVAGPFLRQSLASIPQQLAAYARLASYSEFNHICEVGFGTGHSAAVFLSANPDAMYWAFDTLHHAFSNTSVAALERMFPGRVHVTPGNPASTVPTFIRRGVICDIFFVSGNHKFEDAQAHLANALTVTHPAGVIVADQLSPSCPECVRAWEGMVQQGAVTNVQCDGQGESNDIIHTRWCHGSIAQSKLSKSLAERLASAEPVDAVITFCLSAGTLECGGKYFSSSLRAVAPKVQLVLFADAACAEGLDTQSLRNVLLMPTATMHPIMWRFHVWKEYLQLHARRYRFAMTADMRDVVFQANPMPAIARLVHILAKGDKNVVLVTEEALPADDQDYPYGARNAAAIAGGRYWNGMWLRECFGEDVDKNLRNLSPLNAGVVGGTATGLLLFITKQHEIQQKFCPHLDKMGPDQAITTFMGYTKDWDSSGLTLKVVPNGELVLHIVIIATRFPLRVDTNGHVVNPFDGRVFHMLHQYDRSELINAVIKQKWGHIEKQ